VESNSALEALKFSDFPLGYSDWIELDFLFTFTLRATYSSHKNVDKQKLSGSLTKKDFWARDWTYTLWVKAEHVSHSAMGQIPKTPWYGTRFEERAESVGDIFKKFWLFPTTFRNFGQGSIFKLRECAQTIPRIEYP
jgi:alpha-mannosidase